MQLKRWLGFAHLSRPTYAWANVGHPSIPFEGAPRIEAVQIPGWQGLKPCAVWPRVARLNSCPDTKQKACFELTFEILGTIFRKPGLESVEQRNRVLNMLIGELVIAAFHVVLYQVFEFGPNLHIHTFRLPQSRARGPGTGAEGYRLDKWAEPDSHQSKRLTHNPGRAFQS
jgi:hypothetical protein